jgi:hypothetical protein
LTRFHATGKFFGHVVIPVSGSRSYRAACRAGNGPARRARGNPEHEPRYRTSAAELARVTGLTERSIRKAAKLAGLARVPEIIGRKQLEIILQFAFVSAARGQSPVRKAAKRGLATDDPAP